jgi:hypothetical protein
MAAKDAPKEEAQASEQVPVPEGSEAAPKARGKNVTLRITYPHWNDTYISNEHNVVLTSAGVEVAESAADDLILDAGLHGVTVERVADEEEA